MKTPSDDSQARLLWGDKPNGAKVHSSGEINLPSSQPMLARIGVATDANAPRRPSAGFSPFGNSSGELKLMVLKHAPLGEINLPFVASSANAPRCRRKQRSPPVGAKGNRRFHCFQRPKGSASAHCSR